MSRVVLSGAAVLVDGAWVSGRAVVVEEGLIRGVVADLEAGGERVALPPGSLLAPGLIDIQVNGGGGILFNDAPTGEAALAIAAAHRVLGTTAILPTLITDRHEVMARAAEAVGQAVSPSSPVIGVHFEGPFLNPKRPGVHDPAHLRAPTGADLALLEGLARRLGGPVLLTLAPECVDDGVIARLAAAGVVLSAGHTAASFERMGEAAALGVSGFTHLWNAMPPVSARDPGPVAAALALEEAWCGVIADGIHVHPALLRLLLAGKRTDRVILVSDAMPPAGTGMGAFMLQGRTILRREGRLVTGDGVLAGADLCLLEGVRRLVSLARATPAQALSMASATPAAFLGVGDRLGRIGAGYRADMVLLTPGLDLLGTWLAGEWEAAA